MVTCLFCYLLLVYCSWCSCCCCLPFFLRSSFLASLLPCFLASLLPFLPSFLPSSFLVSLLSSLIPSFLPSFFPSFFPSFLLPSFLLPCFLASFLPSSFLVSLLPSFLPSFLRFVRFKKKKGIKVSQGNLRKWHGIHPKCKEHAVFLGKTKKTYKQKKYTQKNRPSVYVLVTWNCQMRF